MSKLLQPLPSISLVPPCRTMEVFFVSFALCVSFPIVKAMVCPALCAEKLGIRVGKRIAPHSWILHGAPAHFTPPFHLVPPFRTLGPNYRNLANELSKFQSGLTLRVFVCGRCLISCLVRVGHCTNGRSLSLPLSSL